MHDIPFCCFRHDPTLTLEEGNDTVYHDTADSIKYPDKNADDQNTDQNDDGVVDHLALRRPNNLLQLALHFAEPAADSLGGTDENVFLFRFCHVVHPFCNAFGIALLRLVMNRVLLAESAILLHLKTVRVILLVLHGVVVSLLAFAASECDFHAHDRHLLN